MAWRARLAQCVCAIMYQSQTAVEPCFMFVVSLSEVLFVTYRMCFRVYDHAECVRRDHSNDVTRAPRER